MKLNKYNVTLHGTLWIKAVVKAADAQSARLQALDAADIFEAEYSWDEVDVLLVEKKPRKKRSDPKQMKLDV